MANNDEIVRYTVSMVRQNKYKFYSLTMHSELLARCCYVSTRDSDPKKGFQRVLDKKRAQEIAEYIDSGQGSIPSAIILSAQPEAEINIVGRGRTLEFRVSPKSFLILDGQHRVYGFSLAKSDLRVPVIIYNDLTRRDESRLFIDINSKQRGVPTELLLDIKNLAECENTHEELMRELFDTFHKDMDSVLLGLLSPHSKKKGKITRVTFNSAFQPVLKVFGDRDLVEIYETVNAYLYVWKKTFFEKNNIDEQITNSVVFKAIVSFFPEIAVKVKDRHGPIYTTDNFHEVMRGMIVQISPTKFKKPGTSYKALLGYLQDNIKTDFVI